MGNTMLLKEGGWDTKMKLYEAKKSESMANFVFLCFVFGFKN